jgi:ATP-dependent protease ClpP protease subunit
LLPRTWYEINRTGNDVAEVYVYDEIGLFGISAKDFIADLRGITQSNVKLHINSPGGSVDDGIAIYNAIKSHKATFESHIDALCASIATVIAMGSERVVMAPHSRMMIHEAMALGIGHADDFDKMAERLRACSENIASIYAEKAGKDTTYWRAKMADETWYTDQQAVDEGLADEVGRDSVQNAFKIAANFNLSKFRNAPEFTPEANDPMLGDGWPTISMANVDRLHTIITDLRAIHDGVCEDEHCMLHGPSEANTDEPESEPEPTPEPVVDGPSLARRELEEAIARRM